MDELFATKAAIGMEIRTTKEFIQGGDPNGVWTPKLAQLEQVYRKLERALGRV